MQGTEHTWPEGTRQAPYRHDPGEEKLMAAVMGETLYIRAGVELSRESWNAVQEKQMRVIFMKEEQVQQAIQEAWRTGRGLQWPCSMPGFMQGIYSQGKQ